MSIQESDKITDIITLRLPFSQLVVRVTGGPNLEYAAELLRPPLCTEENGRTEAQTEYDPSNPPLKGIYLSQTDILAALNLLVQAKAVAENKSDLEGHPTYGPSTIWADYAADFTTQVDQCSKESSAEESSFPPARA